MYIGKYIISDVVNLPNIIQVIVYIKRIRPSQNLLVQKIWQLIKAGRCGLFS